MEEINLENNNLSELYFNSFTLRSQFHVFFLKVLNLKKNPIKYIDAKFINSDLFGNLMEFYLDNQNSLIDNSIKTKYYKNNQILKTINSDYFKETPNLQIIQLNSDQIESIERNALRELKFLTRLNLANNSLNKICDFYFEKLFNLHELDLSNNKITFIENFFFFFLKK